MAVLDWIVLAAYLVIITAIGLIAGARVRDTGNYFLGHRKFGPWLMIGQSFGVGTHAEMPVSLAGAVYRLGASGIWFQWKNLFATPFFWIMAPIFRRIRRTTIAEMTEDRYGWWMGALYIVFAMIFFIMNVASMLKGAGKVISQATGGYVAVNEIVVGMTVIFIVYSFIGGLVAAAWTDLFQGFLIIVLSFMLVPFGWELVGGLEGIRQSLPAAHMSLATDVGIDVWTIVMLTVNGLIGIMAQLSLWQLREARLHGRVGAGGTDRRGDHRAGALRRREAGRCGRRVRVRVPASALPRSHRAADCRHPRRKHVDLLGVHGGQRCAVHAGALPAPDRPRKVG